MLYQEKDAYKNMASFEMIHISFIQHISYKLVYLSRHTNKNNYIVHALLSG